ncbi:MAG: hypothetical protein RI894_612, partial [Bacteroidota bacterium]
VLVENKHNPGFSIANNQAIRISSGKYVLLLNPDTVVQEDTFQKTVAFMEAHLEAGGLGIRMIDGSGRFLPESKRGFPSPLVAFYKVFGLSALFPHSEKFNKYGLGYLSERENHEVEVLAGAFMLMRREALDKVGLLDEAFFMYGEDIDLSYRLVLGGYKNYYFAESTIIHYKGESTKKGSLNYVKAFYEAMIIFAKKHFTGSSQRLFVAFLEFAIYFRAAITLISNLLLTITLPAIDASVIFIGMWFLKNFYALKVFHNVDYYDSTYTFFNIPLYITVWLSSVWLSGGYDNSRNLSLMVRGLAVGALVLTAVYGLLDMEYRSSRALLLMGAGWAAIGMTLVRYALNFIKNKNFYLSDNATKNVVIVADTAESNRVMQVLNQAQVRFNLIGTVAPESQVENAHFDTKKYVGTIEQLDEIVRIYKVNEIIFCSKNIASETIMQWMSRLGTGVEYKIVPLESWSVIGSSNKDTAGELYTIDIRYRIAEPLQKRHKRLFDLAASGLLLSCFPLLFIFIKKDKMAFFKNIFAVLAHQKTWIGYNDSSLPRLKPAVFSPEEVHDNLVLTEATKTRLRFLYAKDYTVSDDWDILWKCAFKLK